MKPTDCQCLICGTAFARKRYGKNLYCSHPCRGKGRRTDPVASFWAKVAKSDERCWLWTGAAHDTGYGVLSVRGKLTLAHRFSYEHHVGPIADGLHCLHRCDTPACVRPDHLFLGTNNDNIRDRVSKGRRGFRRPSVSGAANRNAKLTDDAVRRMRELAQAGASQKSLAVQFGVSHAVANKIVNRKAWAHVA